jgi:hypothetical protein
MRLPRRDGAQAAAQTNFIAKPATNWRDGQITSV